MIIDETLINDYYHLHDKFHKYILNAEENREVINQEIIDNFFNILRHLQSMIFEEEEVDTQEFKKILNSLNFSYNEIYKELKIAKTKS